jgi:hypothetical protein
MLRESITAGLSTIYYIYVTYYTPTFATSYTVKATFFVKVALYHSSCYTRTSQITSVGKPERVLIFATSVNSTKNLPYFKQSLKAQFSVL